MAIDTRSKRASAAGLLLPFILVPPAPDGAITAGDRAHQVWNYSGHTAAPTPNVEPPGSGVGAGVGRGRIVFFPDDLGQLGPIEGVVLVRAPGADVQAWAVQTLPGGVGDASNRAPTVTVLAHELADAHGAYAEMADPAVTSKGILLVGGGGGANPRQDRQDREREEDILLGLK